LRAALSVSKERKIIGTFVKNQGAKDKRRKRAISLKQTRGSIQVRRRRSFRIRRGTETDTRKLLAPVTYPKKQRVEERRVNNEGKRKRSKKTEAPTPVTS